ncbi:PREDICTED: uncharacterized protein LOC107167491 [Diuraphis noxia]|uniref:uncharacterized protein LOC107167491 n=1 Tax=Diuraphis noxia TaxID=143948 RepID=UPI000763AD79|nr:PREDICTED: uncharacterized protein LOC107167491 [Diuraphis noxia]
MNDSICPAWSDDVDPAHTISLSSLNITSGVDIPKQVNQVENVHEVCLPPELMEKIVCYFDCDTLFKFKQLSKTCHDITNNALRFNKQWKKICHLEIPKKYLIDLFTKQLDNKIPFDLLSDNHYETAYKNWLYWQNPVFKLSLIGQHDFLGHDGTVKIICHKNNVMIVFSNFMYLFSITKNQNTGNYDLINIDMEACKINTLVVLNPRPETNQETGEDNIFIDCHENHSNVCPLHNTKKGEHDGKKKKYTGNLVDVDMNFYTNTCCWVRETWYEWHSNIDSKITKGHFCPHLSCILFTSVVHGLIISRNQINSILIHGIHKDSCIMVRSWLKKKHAGASAVYLYTNILFIGTINGFLLAYRLHCMDDLISLKDKNILFEKQLEIGLITMFDIMDFEDVKAIVVASENTVLWIKIN